MKRAAAMGAVLFIANGAGAQCLCDLNGDAKVGINELVIGVQNALTECQSSGLKICPKDFTNDGTQSPDCYYAGTWDDQTCATDFLQTGWRSTMVTGGTLLVIQVSPAVGDFVPPLFFVAAVTSPTSAFLIGWMRGFQLDAVIPVKWGYVFLNDSGRRLTIATDFDPFVLEGTCLFLPGVYEGALTDVVRPPALRSGASPSIDPAALERLRAALGAGGGTAQFLPQIAPGGAWPQTAGTPFQAAE